MVPAGDLQFKADVKEPLLENLLLARNQRQRLSHMIAIHVISPCRIWSLADPGPHWSHINTRTAHLAHDGERDNARQVDLLNNACLQCTAEEA